MRKVCWGAVLKMLLLVGGLSLALGIVYVENGLTTFLFCIALLMIAIGLSL